MTNIARKALLPAGMQDVLPPDAAFEAHVAESLLACFAGFGYERVKPPLVEFEESLLGGVGAAMSDQTFRLMDPASHRMMAVRADMTLQVARIATTRLRSVPRPLRLSYAGEILRVRSTALRPERQFIQAGVELIGAATARADAEVVLIASEALSAIGVERLSIDLNMPTLVPALCHDLGLDDALRPDLREALDRKDVNAVGATGGPAAELLCALLEAVGPAAQALDKIKALDLPPRARIEADRMHDVAALLAEAAPKLALTVDPVEHRGFEYHTGISFSFFARDVRGELGRGGRYRAGTDGADEPATGFTLFLDSALRALPRPKSNPRVFLPTGTPSQVGRELRADGWTTVADLAPAADETAAERLGCSHIGRDGALVPLDGADGDA